MAKEDKSPAKKRVTFKETVSSLHGVYLAGKTYDLDAEIADDLLKNKDATDLATDDPKKA
jgi:hypothetical protein